MRNAVLLALVLPAAASAARYDPDADRAALRDAATACRTTVIDATGLALEPAKVPAIVKGLDEGSREAALASAAASSLDAAARARAGVMDSAAKSCASLRHREAYEPVAAAAKRRDRAAAEATDLRTRVDALPDEAARKKLGAALSKAEAALDAAAAALRPLDAAASAMTAECAAMAQAGRAADDPLVELSSAAAAALRAADGLPPAAAAAKERLAALTPDGDGPAKTRAAQALELARDAARALFESADRACNRADDFRRRSAAFEKSSSAWDRARATLAAGPFAAVGSLAEAEKALASVRDALDKPAPKP